MNGYERIHAALEGRPVDRTPVMLHNFLMAAREGGYTQAAFRNDAANIADAFIRAVEKYGYDGVLIDIDTALLAGALGVPVEFPEDLPARCHRGLLHDIGDIGRLPPIQLENDRRVMILLESARLLVEHFDGELSIRGNCDQSSFSLAALVRSMQDWMLDLTDEEARPYVHRLLDYCSEAACRMIRLMAETGVDMVSNGDSLAGPAMISPAMYREFALPYERRVIDEAHAHGLPYALHICGDTSLILHDMVQTGTDAVELDYQTDIHRAHEVYRDSICFIGNVDPSGVLARGTPDLVRQKTEELLEVYADSTRFILNAGCAIPAETPPENLRAMIAVTRT